MKHFLKFEKKAEWLAARERSARAGTIVHTSIDCMIQGFTIKQTVSTIKEDYSLTVDEEIDLYF